MSSSHRLLPRLTAEFLGCMMFHFIGSLEPTSAANSVSLMTIVFFTAKISGGHLNPIISIIFSILGYTPPFELFLYVLSQISGCIVGALWLALLVPGLGINSGVSLPYDGCFLPSNGISDVRAMGFEAVGSFMFALTVFSVVWYTYDKHGYGITGPIMVGMSLLSSAYAVGGWTGSALNPARVLGSFVVFRCVSGRIVCYYILGELIGAFCSIFVILPWYGISPCPWYSDFIDRISYMLNTDSV